MLILLRVTTPRCWIHNYRNHRYIFWPCLNVFIKILVNLAIFCQSTNHFGSRALVIRKHNKTDLQTPVETQRSTYSYPEEFHPTLHLLHYPECIWQSSWRLWRNMYHMLHTLNEVKILSSFSLLNYAAIGSQHWKNVNVTASIII